MKKIKIYFSKSKYPNFSQVSPSSKKFFKSRIKNKDYDIKKWWIMEFYDNKSNNTIFSHSWLDELIPGDFQELWATAIRKAISMQWENDLEIKLVFDRSIKSINRFFIEKWALMWKMKDDFFKEKTTEDTKKLKNKWDYKININWILNKKLFKIVWAIDIARELVCKPSNIIDPVSLENFVKEILDKDKSKWIKVTYFWQKEIEKEKMNLFLAVNRWSKDEAKMIVMEYEGRNEKGKKWKLEEPIILIWKWLTYDSWWYYFKSHPHMNEMHWDMAWSAVVIWIMSALKELWIKKRVIWIIWITENMIDANSYKNWDIYVGRNWKSVEISHTDAEGRLVLADIIAYSFDTYNPKLVIDIATLTWACPVALWEMYTWIFSWNKNLIRKFEDIWEKVNDLIWPLPLDKYCFESIKWTMSDICNASNLRWLLWASTAAAFLANFAKDTKKWIHLDIAWSGFRSKMRRSYDLQNGIWTWSTVHAIIEYLSK